MAAPRRYACIHGHFYQPPRENPWTGVLPREASANPFRDWNHRIAHECYSPLAATPLYNSDNRIEAVRNLYSRISFDMGPTLLAWLKNHAPEVQDELASASALSGQPPLAQAYAHPILPLCDRRDLYTQILWGLREFSLRFGRQAVGMWLPETAINPATLTALIDCGIKFILLSPSQAAAWRRLDQHRDHLRPVTSEQPLDPTVAYRLYDISVGGRIAYDRWLDVLFYHTDVSLAVSFDHALRDSNRMIRLFTDVYQKYNVADAEARIVIMATDGEIYGHHEENGNATLAWLADTGFSAAGLKLTMPGDFLSQHPPKREVRLQFGVDGLGSSWSCSHGVGRWHRDCGCRMNENNGRQIWRQPLRLALDNLRDVLRRHFVQIAAPLLHDPWEARNDYIDIAVNPYDDKLRQIFLNRHASRPNLANREMVTVWKCLEAQRHALLMYASCGWFFDNLSGLEPSQNLRHACRAAELMEEAGAPPILTDFTSALAEIPSNHAEDGNCLDIWRRQVTTVSVKAPQAAAAQIFGNLFGYTPQHLPEFQIKIAYSQDAGLPQSRGSTTAGASHQWIKDQRLLSQGCAIVRNLRTQEIQKLDFVACALKDIYVAGVFFYEPRDNRDFLAAMQNLSSPLLAEKMGREAVLIPSLPEEDAETAYLYLNADILQSTERSTAGVAGELRPLIRRFTQVGIKLPPGLDNYLQNYAWGRVQRGVYAWIKSQCSTARLDTIFSDAASDYALLGRQLDLSPLRPVISADLAHRLRAFCSQDHAHAPIDDLTERLLFLRDWGISLSSDLLGLYLWTIKRRTLAERSLQLRNSLRILGLGLELAESFLRDLLHGNAD